MEKQRSEKFNELMIALGEARAKFEALKKGAERSHMPLEQYADSSDLEIIEEELDAILMEAKDRLSDYDEYNGVVHTTIDLLDVVVIKKYQAKYASQK